MHPTVDIQLLRLAVLFLVGIWCNILFQTYTALRAATSPSKLTGHLLDGLIALIVLTSIAGAVFWVNCGEIRLYILIAIAMGFAVSNVLVGGMVYTLVFVGTKRSLRVVRSAKNFVKSSFNRLTDKARAALTVIWKNPPNNGNSQE